MASRLNPYISFEDDARQAMEFYQEVFGGTLAFPTTAFYDARGRLAFIHQGAYATRAKLAEDIRRYASR